ncbi:PASTA domain containing protein [Thermodesulfatator indicus DSM 15286]|uniref:beta-lactamase n=1 Tax=Thermodesulfatator indicus (strain DSM 15286 / JCM 11887 / CIR29812) TaxID=667014 RepID=F8AAP8_THEID|nr:PASTA domain-containing protein [Thermodesulfatator indicus]AEH44321.1 PASTA domain containing protein [Thermodesulfatator indicus DSM 15286]
MKKVWLLGLIGIALLILAGEKAYLFSSPEPILPEKSGVRSLGPVYDLERRTLAESITRTGLLLVPGAFSPSPKNIETLAKALGKKEEELSLFLATHKEPVLFQRVKFVPEIEGVFPKNYFERSYPYKDICSAFLGDDGLSGVEAYYYKLLRRKGSYLVTSIEIEKQKALFEDLNRSLKRLRAKRGGAIILDLETGRIKALVSKGDKEILFKPRIPLEVLGKVFEGNFEKSSYEDMASFLRDLGFGEATGIDLPNEEPGLLPPAISSLEDVRASGVQLVRALAALSTGKLFSPKLAKEIRIGKEEETISVETKNLDKITPLERGGVWWWGGSYKVGSFVIAGLWPRKNPKEAFLVYLEGVKAYGLPCYYTRFIPQAVKDSRFYKVANEKKPPRKIPENRMPDLRGLTLKEALETLSALGLEAEFQGFGVTVSQWPAPGTPLKKITKCRLVLR